MQVNELMTRNAECIGPDATLHEAAVRMKALDVGSLPVCDNDRLAGMLTDRDIAMRSVADGHDPRTDRVRATQSVAFARDRGNKRATRIAYNEAWTAMWCIS